jgi:hypothetical protein
VGSAHQRRRDEDAVRLKSLFSVSNIGGIIMMSQFLVNTNLKIISFQYLKHEEFNKSVFPLF